MRQISIFIFVLSFCVALVYLTLQSERGEAWLSSWQQSSSEIQTDTDKEVKKQEISQLRMQVAALSLKIDEQNSEMRAMRMDFSQLRQQVVTSDITTKVDEEQANEKPLINTTESQKRKREQLARLQDVVSKMEMTSLRALNN